MQYLKTYLHKIEEHGNVNLAKSISKTAEDIGTKHIKSFSFISHEIGLLFGNVQSGKTGQMFGILTKAADLGFPAFVLLTTDNVVLQQQTLDRVKSDLDGFCVCGENDSGLFIENSLEKPAIVVLKKNARMLHLWANVFNTTGFMKGNPLFIIDDEADAASLNTLVNRHGQSTINKSLDSIKNGSSSSLYLQVTGTPQAVFLQTIVSGWHPLFSYYFQPGEGYLGGDFFFSTKNLPSCIKYIDGIENPTREVVIRHLAVSGIILASGGKVSNCLIHPSVRQAVHQTFAKEVQAELNWCHNNIDHLHKLLITQYPCLKTDKFVKPDFEICFSIIKKLLEGNEAKIIIMNGRTDVDIDEYLNGCNFIIGGNTLGRGITFPQLQTIYYTRVAKRPQADTMWQHSRMFGYDRDPGLMSVFINESLYKLFSDINATNNSIIAQVEQGMKDVKVYYPQGIKPTRQNVLDKKHVEAISGGVNYYPDDPSNDTIEQINQLLGSFSEDEPFYQVNLRLIKELLVHIVPSPDFKLTSFISIINTILSENPAGQGILIVRRNRDITQGTGALLSPNDWELGGKFTSKVVLTMYQVIGTKGWHSHCLWVPNIKLPTGIVYYDVTED